MILFTKSDTHAVCIFSILTVTVFGVLIVWMINFYRHFYCSSSSGGIEIKMRRPFLMLFAYLLMLPWLLEEVWSTFVLYFSGHSHQIQSTHNDGPMPTIYAESTDLKLHFAFWFCFWCFLHIKLFRLWMIRYDFEHDKEMRNIEWKRDLRLRSIKRSSIIVRYRSVVGNTVLMMSLQFMIVMVNTLLQLTVRLVPILPDMRYTQYYEQSIILSLLIIELSLFLIVMQKEPMRAINDVHHVRAEWILFIKICIVLLCAYLVCLALWFTTNIYLNFTVVRCAAQMLLNMSLFLFGYLDFVWIISRIRPKKMSNNHNDHIDHSNVDLLDILECQDGFESMMRFLVGESLCQHMLCYVECSQFVHKWAPFHDEEACAYRNKRIYLPLIWGYIRQQQSLVIPDDITLLVLSYYKKLYVSLDVRHSMANKFLFFEHLTFDTHAANYRYLIRKYISDTATFNVCLSDKLTLKMLDMVQHGHQIQSPDSENVATPFVIDLVNAAREELWNVILNAFLKFQDTNDYVTLAKEIRPLVKEIEYKDLQYSIHLPVIPKVTDIEGSRDCISIDIHTM
eukprot:84965_1